MFNYIIVIILSCGISIYPLSISFIHQEYDMFFLICLSLFFRMLDGISYIKEYYIDYDYDTHHLIHVLDFASNVILFINTNYINFVSVMSIFICFCLFLEFFFRENIKMITFRLALWNILFYSILGYSLCQ